MNNLVNFGRPNNNTPFDSIRHLDGRSNEYWIARELMPLLGYEQWRRFEETIERAKLTCQNSGQRVDDHFANADKMVERPQGGGSKQSDYRLTRHACYLIAMNGDPRKPEIALAQSYFAATAVQVDTLTPIQMLVVMAQQLAEQERQQIETQRQLVSVQSDIDSIKQVQTEAEQSLKALPAPEKIVPTKTTRANLNRLIRDYCHMTGVKHNNVWRELYREFRDRYHTDLSIRAANGKSAPLDVAESLDMMDDLYALACEMFKSTRN